VLREEEEARVAGELQDELARCAAPRERDWHDLPGLCEVAGTEEGRLKLASVLRRVIDAAWLLIVPRHSYRLCAVQLFFAGGARRDYLILCQAAACNRPGGWWARSLADAVKPGDLDLRRRADAAKLEAALAGIDPAELAG
jgi:hypothetical protein